MFEYNCCCLVGHRNSIFSYLRNDKSFLAFVLVVVKVLISQIADRVDGVAKVFELIPKRLLITIDGCEPILLVTGAPRGKIRRECRVPVCRGLRL